MTTNEAGKNLIKDAEGLRLTAYRCPAGVPTIGWGTTLGVTMGMTITKAQAEELFDKDLVKFEKAVERNVKVALNENQFSALVSFTYNLGEGNLKSSTLLRKINAGDFQGAAAEFAKWNKASGKVLPGLTKRRADERALFLAPVADSAPAAGGFLKGLLSKLRGK